MRCSLSNLFPEVTHPLKLILLTSTSLYQRMALFGRASNAMRVGGAFKVHAHKKRKHKEQPHKSHISKSTSRSFPPSVFSNDPTSPKGGKLRATFHRRRGPVWNFLRWVRVTFPPWIISLRPLWPVCGQIMFGQTRPDSALQSKSLHGTSIRSSFMLLLG